MDTFFAAQNNQADESHGYQLITRLIEARTALYAVAQEISNANGDDHGMHRAVDEIDIAITHITVAIEAL